MLCSLCRSLGTHYVPIDDASHKGVSGYSLAYLEQSVNCEVCQMLQARAFTYPSVYKDGISVTVSPGRGVTINKNGQGSGIYVNFFPFCTPALTLQKDREIKAKGGYLCPGRLSQANASSEECMELARDWLRNCMESHERCNKITSHGLPGRFLDVGGDRVKLVTTKKANATYIALSHTWGKMQPLTTTKSTLQDRLEEIPLSSLPPTFRDAVLVTRRLGCRYLWIDSLCIIQDSHEDWEAESSKMHSVYRGALVTISALCGSNSSAGLFATRILKKHVELPVADIIASPVYITVDLESRHDLLRRSVLSSRGWTLQERLLSPRLLHFSEDEILWECMSCLSREGSREESERLLKSANTENYAGPLVDFNMPPFDWSKQPAMLSILNEMAGADSIDPFTNWYCLVSIYSGRNLTFDTDKLPAVSGIVAEMQRQTQYTYVAGLWKEDILAGLCWRLYPNFDASSVKRYQEYRAPSWSWASLNGKIEYFDVPVDNMFDSSPRVLDTPMSPNVTQVQATPAGLDPAGAIVSGFITIKGLQMPVSITHKPSFAKSHRIRLAVDTVLASMLRSVFLHFNQRDVFSFAGVLDSIEDAGLTSCICLPIAIREVDSFNYVVCLLLAPRDDHSGTKRRIGVSWMQLEQATAMFAVPQRLGKRDITIL